VVKSNVEESQEELGRREDERRGTEVTGNISKEEQK
jgi:hypothetical protein